MISFLLSQRWRLSFFFIVIALLFVAAFIPAIGIKAAPWHVEIHLLTYAGVGALTYWTLSRIKFYWRYTIILLIPIIHEVCEIWGHHHALEVKDIALNLIGMSAGTIFAILWLQALKRVQNKRPSMR